jgi:hypothetical protein
MNSLSLEKEIPADVRLDVVVITTPCVDVSARGRGLAQNGQVRSRAELVHEDLSLPRPLPLLIRCVDTCVCVSVLLSVCVCVCVWVCMCLYNVYDHM